MALQILVQFQASEPERLRRNSRRSHYRENEPLELRVKAPLYSQQVDKDVGTELCNDNGSEASPLALIWGTGLQGVVASLAKRKAEGFDSLALHHESL